MVSDAELVLQSQQGDKEAIGFLYDRHVKDIYRFVYIKTHNKEQAEDITSDVFEQVVKKIHTFQPSKASFRTWLYTIARHKLIDMYRKGNSPMSIDTVSDDAASYASHHMAVADTLLLSDVRAFLATLSDTQRDVLLLRLWHDMPYDEIATILDISPAHARVIYQRGIQVIRSHMGIAMVMFYFLSL